MSSKGMKRPRDSRGEWPKQIFKTLLGLNPKDDVWDKVSDIWHEARSKTVYLDPEKKVQISSRQYVIYTAVDSVGRTPMEDSLINEILDRISFTDASGMYPGSAPRLGETRCIGFWRARIWIDLLLILVNHGAPTEDGAPPAFRIVGAFKRAPQAVTYEILLNERDYFGQLKPFLNTSGNISDPPKIHSNFRPFAEKALESARTFWDDCFTKNTSSVTKGRFEAVTRIRQKDFVHFTRLQSVVDKEDWLKMAVFLSNNCDDARTLHTNSAELREAAFLVGKNILHFSLMTMVDEYKICESGEDRVDIIPAFRLWKVGVYVLFIRKACKIHRFFLCKHYADDPLMLGYDPFSDSIIVHEMTDPELFRKRFFYIMPRGFETSEPIPIFDSLKQLCEETGAIVKTE